MKIILLGIVVFVLFVLLDLMWFQVAGNFFKSQIGSIARLTPEGAWNIRLLPAALVYVCMTVGILVFILPHSTSIPQALILGAIFGCIAYGIYDLTNLATLSAWTVRFAVVDILWGTILCGSVSGMCYWLSRLTLFS